ncbi:MAG: prenyltransferase/squalene oxidase repeat-containing protein [Planctomycetales bacterium]
MPSEPYLLRLAARLGRGLERMPAGRRERHREFIMSQQMPDGGFSGRDGQSDLYYTSFAVRGLAVLGGLTPEQAESVCQYVRARSQDSMHVIDRISWLYTALVVLSAGRTDVFDDAGENWEDRIVEQMERVRTKDGGYAKSEDGSAGSTYHSFLVTLSYELLGRELPDPEGLVRFLYDRQRDDGGFVEIAPMKRSGTNPTAAAVAILRMFDRIDDELRDDVRCFLQEVHSPEGGFQANTRIPFADGLSTFTGLLTAQDLRLTDVCDPDCLERFVTDPEEGLELPTGGFRGAGWDEQADVEYTFYGLGVLGLLWSDEGRE